MIMEITPEYLPSSWPSSYPAEAKLIPLRLLGLSLPVANWLREEIMALGGNGFIPSHEDKQDSDPVELILLGTRENYELLWKKLEDISDTKFDQPKKDFEQYLFRDKPSIIRSPWGRELDFQRTRVMGIINITSDSFYAASAKETLAEVMFTAEKMIAEGADILDLGGMSTRPGSAPIEEAEEVRRIVQAVKAIRQEYPRIMLSVDTYRAKVAEQALANGADIINDISGFAFDAKLLEVIIKHKAPYILMHIKGTPKDMQLNPTYTDLLLELLEYFTEKIDYAVSRGLDENNIILDPGLGFGKRYEDNMEILDRLTELKSLKKPLLIGASRKSFVGTALSLPLPEDRLEGTLAVTALCAHQNIEIVRVHDVQENLWVIKMMEAIKCRRPSSL